MSSASDPTAVTEALGRAQAAFEMTGHGRPVYETGISTDENWKAQLTKACRLVEVADTLRSQGDYYTAIIGVCFGAIERLIEAYALAMTNDTLREFRDHEFGYDRAYEVGLFERETAENMKALYGENRTESYYGGSRPTEDQAEAMADLAVAVHEFSAGQIREGGVCLCD
jgi:hypothetical protein